MPKSDVWFGPRRCRSRNRSANAALAPCTCPLTQQRLAAGPVLLGRKFVKRDGDLTQLGEVDVVLIMFKRSR